MDSVASLLNTVMSPLLMPTDPGRRLFWLFILSALLLASIAVSLQQKRFDPVAQCRALLNRRYWFNRSTITDYSLLIGNNLLRALLIVPLLGGHLAGTIAVGSWLQTSLGDPPSLALPLTVIAISYTLLFFIFEDLSRFLLHMTMHKVPLLWRLHRTHHSATTLTPLTLFRVHPAEMALYYLRGLMVFSLISGVFVYLFRGQVSGIDILGVDCLGFLFNALGANLRHSPVFLSFGRAESFFISPAQHQLHHSRAAEHHDINFGTCLAIWDRMLKSWRPSGSARPIEFGLLEPAVEHSPFNIPNTGASCHRNIEPQALGMPQTLAASPK